MRPWKESATDERYMEGNVDSKFEEEDEDDQARMGT
jgi:hypothetical protein